eukprot:9769336-Lingulodinium_polyedra.AAC.1
MRQDHVEPQQKLQTSLSTSKRVGASLRWTTNPAMAGHYCVVFATASLQASKVRGAYGSTAATASLEANNP